MAQSHPTIPLVPVPLAEDLRDVAAVLRDMHGRMSGADAVALDYLAATIQDRAAVAERVQAYAEAGGAPCLN